MVRSVARGWPVLARNILVAALAASCTGGVPPTDSPTAAAAIETPIATPTPTPSAVPGTSAGAEPAASPSPEPLPSGLDPEIAAAISWRRDEIGLRYDLDWVLEVARDPTAVQAFAHPIMPEEESFVWARQERLHRYLGGIKAHAAEHVDVFGGLYLDNAHGRVMTLWTEDPEGHLAAILAEAGPDAPIAAGQVRWSERELREVQERIDWRSELFAQVVSAPMGIGADIMTNVVTIEVSSANPDAPRLIAEGFARELDVPVEMLRVESDGTGVELFAYGTVKGRVVLADGSRPGANDLMVDGDPDTIGSCGGGDIGYGVREDGRFEIPCKVGDYTIVIKGSGEADGDWIVVGRAHVTVREGKTTRVRITLDEGARIRG